MSGHRQISDSSNMDKEAENMDKTPSSPAFSTNSEITEITNIPVSGIIDQTIEDLDELMYCDDILNNEEFTCPRIHSTISQESIITYSSCWCSSDSDISEVITSFDQNVDEEITKVCYSFLYPENLETDDSVEKEEVQATVTASTSRHFIGAEESLKPSSCASSSSTNRTITKAGNMVVSHVIYDGVVTLEASTLEVTEAVKTLQSTEAVKTMEATETFKTLEVTESVKTLQFTEAVKTLEATGHLKIIKDSDVPPQSDLSLSPLVLLEEEQDVTPRETGNVVPSPTSSSPFPPTDQVNEILQPKSQALAGTVTDFQEEVRSSASRQSRDSHDGGLKGFPSRPSEDAGHLAVAQEDKEAVVDGPLFLNSSTITALIRGFFQSLSEEQWREVSEGVYNYDVKEQLTDMCTDVRRFISESVAKNIFQAICQGHGSTSGTFNLKSPLSSSAPLTEILGITEYNMQRNLQSSFSKAFCDVVGADTPGRVSPKFTGAIAGEVIAEINSVLSVALQTYLDGGSSSITAAANCLVSKNREAKKTLEGAITTMKSFLTGRGTAMKRRIQTDNGSNLDSKEETPAGGCKGKKKKSQWDRCFSGWSKKIQAAPLEHLEDEEAFSQSSVEQFQPDSKCLSNNQYDDEETKAKKSIRIFRNIFSNNEKKMKKEKKNKASTENQMKRPSFWMRLFSHSLCSQSVLP